MPTTRRKRSRQLNELPLTFDLADYLCGIQRTGAEIDRLRASGTKYDEFLEFDPWSDEQVATLWQCYRADLEAHARRYPVGSIAHAQ